MCRSSVSPDFGKQIMDVLFILRYNGSLVHLNGRKIFTAIKFNPHIFSKYGLALSYALIMFILMILYEFCLLHA
jgi:hypothetical protein